VKPDATRFFVCPSCHGDLQLHSTDSAEIVSGQLRCGGCGREYPIVAAIPRFVAGEDYSDTFGRQWNRWTRTQHDSMNGMMTFRDRFLRYTGWTLDGLAGKTVVDAGCGAGPYLDVVEGHAATVIGFDLSHAVDAAYRLHGQRPNVHLAQGDIFNPPIRRGIADHLFTFGVVQHTPDPERAFRSLIPIVKKGGEIAVWVYRKSVIPQPSYWLRRLTAGMREPRASQFLEWYVPKAYAVSGAFGKVPKLGRYLRRLVPVADYRDRVQMTDEQYREWAMLDTHDMLITRYTHPQRWNDLLRWTRGLEQVRKPHTREMSAVARVPPG
jgi:SAM-dependent methyltransferase